MGACNIHVRLMSMPRYDASSLPSAITSIRSPRTVNARGFASSEDIAAITAAQGNDLEHRGAL